MRSSRASTARASSMPATLPAQVCQLARSCATRSRPARSPSSAPSSSRKSATRLPCRSTARSSRRTRSGVGAWKRSTRSARSSAVSPSSAAARMPAAYNPWPSPSAASSACFSCSPRNGSSWKRESSQRSSASPSWASSSASASCGQELLGDRRAKRVESRRLAGRRGRRDRQHRADAVRPPVEPLEQHGPGRDGRVGCEADRGDGVGELARRVGRVACALLERALELEHAEPVRLAAEVARQQPVRLGPHRRELARRGRAHADAAAELDLRAARDADERRDGAVRVPFAVERLLELRV